VLYHSQSFRWLTASLLLIGSVASKAESVDASDWFERMSNAFANQTYAGVFVYSNGNRMDSLRVYHTLVDGREREHIVRLDGERYELIRDGDHLVCVHASDWTGDIQHQIPSGPFAKAFVRDLTKLNQYYSFEPEGETRVVDRDAVSFSVKPKDENRYGYRIWLDKETGLLLKSVLLDGDNVLERFQFTQLQVGGAIDEANLELDSTGDALVHYPRSTKQEQEENAEVSSRWQLAWLPPGFELSSQAIRREISEDNSADTLTFSDGIAAFSVFIDAADDDVNSDMVAQTGATAAVMHKLQTTDGSYNITVVGEVPMETVKRLASSVEQVESP